MGFSGGAALSAADEAQLQKIDELAVASSPASSSLAALLNTANSNLGTTSDAASPTGSANAKLAALLGRLGSATPSIINQATAIGTSATTILSLTGPGIISLLLLECTLSSSVYITNVTITQDGSQIYNGNPTTVYNTTYTGWTNFINSLVKFNSSFTVVATSYSSGSYGIIAQYVTGVE